MPGILRLLGSDYFPSPHAGCARQQINYAAQHNARPIQHATGRVKIGRGDRGEAEFTGGGLGADDPRAGDC